MNIKIFTMFLNFVQCVLKNCSTYIAKYSMRTQTLSTHKFKKIHLILQKVHRIIQKKFIAYNIKCSSYIKKMFNGYYEMFVRIFQNFQKKFTT